MAAGAVLTGVAGGLAMRGQSRSRNPLKRMSTPSIPKSLKNIDAESITSAAQQIGKIGRQVGEVADAAEKARKKTK